MLFQCWCQPMDGRMFLLQAFFKCKIEVEIMSLDYGNTLLYVFHSPCHCDRIAVGILTLQSWPKKLKKIYIFLRYNIQRAYKHDMPARTCRIL